MKQLAPTACAACGQPIDQPATGRRRRYCNDACRKRHDRAKAEVLEGFHIPPHPVVTEDADAPAAPAEERLAATIEHEQIVCITFATLVRELPPQLSWRAREHARAVADSLSRNFEVTTDADS